VIRDPGLRFWLDHVGRAGGLVEEDGDRAVVVLPEPLQKELDLPEEVVVTADPDVAEEEEALLLIHGHPVLEQTAAGILQRSDAGYLPLAWPEATLPDGAQMLEMAREQVVIDHGRIDLNGVPAPVHLPLLRAGALVTYTADQMFQEWEEVWVGAHDGMPVAEPLRRALGGWPSGGDDRSVLAHRCLRPDLRKALASAHGLLRDRAEFRALGLSRQAQAALQDELTRAETYYEEAIKSISRRRDVAPGERSELYDAQAEATRNERSRRLVEIEDRFKVHIEIRPLRLHVVLAPALEVPVTVRRGQRAYPLLLTWALPLRRFLPSPCPHCAAASSLVAGRERIGCTECLPRPATITAPAVEPPRAAAPAVAPPVAARQPSPAEPPAKSRRQQPDKAHEAPDEGEAQDRLARLQSVVQKVGDRLGLEFWERVVDRRLWRRVATDSPLSVLYRLYGPLGPLHAVGASPGWLPHEWGSWLAASYVDGTAVTVGALLADDARCAYSLRWRLADGGKAVVREVLPLSGDDRRILVPIDQLPPGVEGRLRHPPRPRPFTDEVARLLWEVDVERLGLPLVVRCLSIWWRAQGWEVLGGQPHGVVAAAMVCTALAHSGTRWRRDEVAAAHGAEVTPVNRAVRLIQTDTAPAARGGQKVTRQLRLPF